MPKQFYIVQDTADTFSKQIIPRKVYDYLSINPIIKPMPITKSRDLIISPNSSIFPSLHYFSPSSPVTTISRIPLGSNCEQNIGLSVDHCGNPTLGPPLIKLSPLVNQGTPATIKIISDDYVFNINVPFRDIRNVINDIYLNAQTSLTPICSSGVSGSSGASGASGPPESKCSSISPNINKPNQITFRIITPTIDSSISTTFDRMLEIIKHINKKYNNVTYTNNNNDHESFDKLLNNLINNYKYKPL